MKMFDWIPALLTVGTNLGRIAMALEVIVRESYGINLSPPDPDMQLEVFYTDPDAKDQPHSRHAPVPAIGDPDPDPEES